MDQPRGPQRLAEPFRGLDWWRLEPRHELILNQAKDATKHMGLAKAATGDLAVAYLPDNPAITIEMSSFLPARRSRWFNPVTGEALAGQGSTDRAGQETFERPAAWEDALLVLQQAPGR